MGFDLSGNNWTPDSEKMGVSICDNIICVNNNNMHGVCKLIFKSLIHFFSYLQSTDTGDYFPEGYNPEEEIAFTSGMMGSQSMGQRNDGPELPGLENLGADAVMSGGIELDSDIPAGMEFIPSSVPDGSFEFNVASTGAGK